MLDRVARLIGGAADGMWLGTFHAVGVRVLRRHAELVGLKSNFTILDTDDQTRLIKQLLQAGASTTRNGRPACWPASSSAGRIARSRPTRCRATKPASSPTARRATSIGSTRNGWQR